MRITWLAPVFSWDETTGHIATFAQARDKLKRMANEMMSRADRLIGLYVPEGTLEVYGPGEMRGKVAAVIRLQSMPQGHSVEDYWHDDPVTGERRWPVGWPCKTVLKPPADECPILRQQVLITQKVLDYAKYASQFQSGPIQLDPKTSLRLTELFQKLGL